jgi:stringent starvation protein B
MIQVKVGVDTRVPMPFVQDGQIALNIGSSATRNLTMNNEGIQFSARFSGVSHEVRVPWSAVMGIFARETGVGMGFELETPKAEANIGDGAASATASVAAQPEAVTEKPVKKPTLTVIK